MDWLDIAKAFPELEESSVSHLELSPEAAAEVVQTFNGALHKTKEDSSDIAQIMMKKLLTRFPNWGDGALLYGISLGIDGKYPRAIASFRHAFEVGLSSQDLGYLTQTALETAEEAKKEAKKAQIAQGKKSSAVLPAFLAGEKSSDMITDVGIEYRSQMQAPILRKAPKNLAKAKMASDKERREVLRKGSQLGEDIQEEIDVSIPKTPAEKMRLTFWIGGITLAVVALGLLVWFWGIPFFTSGADSTAALRQRDFLLQQLEKSKSDPVIQSILDEYNQTYPS